MLHVELFEINAVCSEFKSQAGSAVPRWTASTDASGAIIILIYFLALCVDHTMLIGLRAHPATPAGNGVMAASARHGVGR